MITNSKTGRRFCAEGLPPICYYRHNISGELITIRRGVKGFFETHQKATMLEVEAKNREINVTKAQAQAMFIGSMFGWNARGADPANYTENGKPIRPKSTSLSL